MIRRRWRGGRHRSADGYELTFAVNVLAQHLLLSVLLPALAPGHTSSCSAAARTGRRRSLGLVAPPRWEDPADLARPDLGDDADRSVAGQRAYATSKLAVVLLAHAWQRRHGDRLRVTIYDPGLIPGTGLARDMSPWRQWAWRNILPALQLLPGVTSPPWLSGRPTGTSAAATSSSDGRRTRLRSPTTSAGRTGCGRPRRS